MGIVKFFNNSRERKIKLIKLRESMLVEIDDHMIRIEQIQRIEPHLVSGDKKQASDSFRIIWKDQKIDNLLIYRDDFNIIAQILSDLEKIKVHRKFSRYKRKMGQNNVK